VFMDTKLVTELIVTFEKLSELNDKFKLSFQADHHLPVWLPEPFNCQQRDISASSLTKLWNEDDGNYPLSGIACSSSETIQLALDLNQAKDTFKKQIKKIKKESAQSNTRASKLIEKIIANEHGRSDVLVTALKNARIGRLNLLWCYKHIQVLPPGLRSISWTWANHHKEINRVTHKDALKMLDSLESDSTKLTVARLLDAHPEHEPLAYVKAINPQLRANIVWVQDNEIKRKPVVTSSIVLSQDAFIPSKLKWANTESHNRLSRSDIEIHPEPYIRALNLHKYIAQQGAR